MTSEGDDGPAPTQDAVIRAIVTRLCRPDRAGGATIERAAIMAAGHDAAAILEWITAHGGRPEDAVNVAPRGGLHSRFDGGAPDSSVPRRFILPPGALDES
jgi:hypothetical protein